MQVVRRGDQALGGLGRAGRAGGAVADVEDEVAGPVGAVTDEGAAGRQLGMDGDGGGVDAVAGQPVEVDAAEVVGADAADHPARLAELRDLVDEDRRRAGRKGPISGIGSRNPSPGSVAMISTRISPMVMTFFTVLPPGSAQCAFLG